MSEATASQDIPALIRHVRRMAAAGRLNEARPLLSAVARIAQPSAELWELEARLALQDGRPDLALTVLDRGIAALPDAAPLLLCRAEAQARAGDLPAAAVDAAEAVLRDPADWRGMALLGRVLLDLGRVQEALPCLRATIAAAPYDVPARLALARAQAAYDDTAAALATLADGGVTEDARLAGAAMLLHVQHGDFAAAVALGLAARRAGGADACVLGLLGHALSCLGRYAAAAPCYAAALALAPEDSYVRHLAAAAGLARDRGRAPAEYVRIVFDGYAARFDAHLLGLGYRIPGVMRAALLGRSGGGPVLDLGCGTGLLAVALHDLPLGPFVGVDLSPRMLEAAARRGLYAELHRADLPDFLAAETRRFALALAGDVLPYFGDLGAVFRAIAARLLPGGQFLFSVEVLPGAPPPPFWQLGTQGRFRHAPAHVVAAARQAGLKLSVLRPEIVRIEQDAPAPGLFGVLEHPP